MSPTRVEGQGSAAEQRTAIHNGIIRDEQPDERYGNGMTNLAKTQFVCRVMRYPEAGFDLDLPFPVEDWLASEDNAVICGGLYLSDLRVQFYNRSLEKDPSLRDTLWPKHAEAEFYQQAFNALVFRRLNGAMLADNRILQ